MPEVGSQLGSIPQDTKPVPTDNRHMTSKRQPSLAGPEMRSESENRPGRPAIAAPSRDERGRDRLRHSACFTQTKEKK